MFQNEPSGPGRAGPGRAEIFHVFGPARDKSGFLYSENN